jgi:thymidylate synthase (FAD)
MPAAKLKVSLLSHTLDPEQVCAAAINQCYSAQCGAELKEKQSDERREKLIGIVMGGGHLSTIEHASFTFSIEGVSRACTHQLVRHRHASFSQQSQRYVKLKDGGFDYILPITLAGRPELAAKFEQKMAEIGEFYAELIEGGLPAEDARAVLPNACETKLVMTMNARELLHFLELRLCTRAQHEIRMLAAELLKLVKPLAPHIFAFAGPTCETQKICWEGDMACGRWKSIEGAECRSRNPKVI